MMKKNEFCRIINALMGTELDGTRKELSSWHLDYINSSLLNKKGVWYQKGLEYFTTTYLICRQIHIPWNLELIIHLKDSGTAQHVDIRSSDALYGNYSNTPPEILAYTHTTRAIKPVDITLSFIPPYIHCAFYQIYDSCDRVYCRNLNLSIRKSDEFRVMVARLLNQKSFFKIADLSHIRLADKRRIDTLQKLCLKSRVEPFSLVELGALLLLAMNNIDDSQNVFARALKFDKQNIDAHFWLATICYYCLHDIDKAKHHVHEALHIAPHDARFLSFMHLISWHVTKSQNNSVLYLKKIIENKPNWLLPRIQLALFFIFKEQFAEARKILLKTKLIDTFTSNSLIDRYYATYVIGNVLTNIIVIQELLELTNQRT